MHLGLLCLGDPAHAERHAALVESAVAAEALGLDTLWLAAPPVVLAAIAARTERLRLGASVTPLAEHDALRVAEDYATLDGISNGRIELFAGPGPLADPRPDSGRATDPGRARFRESLELLRRLWTETDVRWSGRFRTPLDGVTVEPHPVQQPHPPLWIGDGSSASAADLAAEFGLPLLLPSVAAGARELAPLIERYRERFAGSGAPRVGAWCSVREGGAALSDRVAESREALGLQLFLLRVEPAAMPERETAGALEELASLAARGAVR